jgi:hypothetical protein
MKRAQILVDPEDWETLAKIAKEKNSSVGSLIRYAVKVTFLESQVNDKRMAAVDTIIKARSRGAKIDYKELINDGRRY